MSCVIFRELKRIFHFSDDVDNFGLRYTLQEYVQKIIPDQASPAGYELFLADFAGIKNFVYDEIEQQDFIEKNNYFAIILNSYRHVYDIGENLERIEARKTNWGKYLLSILGGGGVDCLTPSRIWDEADRFYSWGYNNDGERWRAFDDCAVTPELFRQYYPAWAFEKNPPLNVCPDDLAKVPAVKDFIDACRACYELPNYNGDDHPVDIMPLLPGSCSSPAVIAWTKKRNELENDPAVIASDEELYSFQECEGCNPGAIMFEFLLKDRFTDRNRHVKKKFDLYLQNLASFERLIEWIKEEGAA